MTKRKKMRCEECGEVTLHQCVPFDNETNSGWECCECEAFIPVDEGYGYGDDDEWRGDADPGL